MTFGVRRAISCPSIWMNCMKFLGPDVTENLVLPQSDEFTAWN